jgi:hypothetical protein
MRPISTLTLLFIFAGTLAQTIDVAESTLKISAFGEEVLYYGFAEGDQLIFNFEEVKGKELKEIEIVELPGSSKFMDYKSTRIAYKSIAITRTAIYKFRFANAAISGRICKFKIQRIPANETTRQFNSSVYWRTEYDTTYRTVPERFLVKTDTVAINLIDQKVKVSSQNALNGNPNRTIVDFDLPPNTISWSFYVGVGQEGTNAFDEGKNKFLASTANYAIKFSGYGLMAAVALHGINLFTNATTGDNVKYWFITDWHNVLAFNANQSFMQYKQGDVITEFSQMKNPLSGKVYIGLLNDNIRDAIEVNIKVTAIQVNQVWDTRMVNQFNVTGRNVAYLKN